MGGKERKDYSNGNKDIVRGTKVEASLAMSLVGGDDDGGMVRKTRHGR